MWQMKVKTHFTKALKANLKFSFENVWVLCRPYTLMLGVRESKKNTTLSLKGPFKGKSEQCILVL